MTLGPHEMRFVLDVPVAGTVSQHAGFDVYRPAGADRPLPAVIFVPGPVSTELPVPPRRWPAYAGYGQLAAGRSSSPVSARNYPSGRPRLTTAGRSILSGPASR
jgi:hypothetical protein